jgi:hypothetical protein
LTTPYSLGMLAPHKRSQTGFAAFANALLSAEWIGARLQEQDHP